MKALNETIVYPLVDHPDQIEVTVEETDEKIRYHLTVHSDDVGKVIGKMVGLQKRFRTVVYAAGSDTNKRVYLDIM